MSDTSSPQNGPTPSESPSAEPVTQRFYLDVPDLDVQFNTVKCATCKVVTPQQWTMIQVGDNFGATELLDLQQMGKRLTLCQNCGTLRLVK